MRSLTTGFTKERKDHAACDPGHYMINYHAENGGMDKIKKIVLNPWVFTALAWYPIFKDVIGSIGSIDKIAILIRIILAFFTATSIFSIFAYFRYRIYKSKPNLLFYDSFEDDSEWKKHGSGEVYKSDEKIFSGKYSLKKDANPDPYGGFRLLGKKIRAPFIFSGWIYRSDIEDGRWADRLAIEDENNNGYGFSVSHGNSVTAIERRDGGNAQSGLLKGKGATPPLLKWYHFMMHFGRNGKLNLSIYDSSGVCLININDCKDKRYKEFDRIVVHGGYPYFIDDLKIMSI